MLASASPAFAIDAKDLLGFWKPVDASSAEGRSQGGIAFRADGTGTFLDAPWDDGKNGDVGKLLSRDNPNPGNLGCTFSYTVENALITTHITRAGDIAVDTGEVHWTATLRDQTLRLDTSDGDPRWIAFTLVARPN